MAKWVSKSRQYSLSTNIEKITLNSSVSSVISKISDVIVITKVGPIVAISSSKKYCYLVLADKNQENFIRLFLYKEQFDRYGEIVKVIITSV